MSGDGDHWRERCSLSTTVGERRVSERLKGESSWDAVRVNSGPSGKST